MDHGDYVEMDFGGPNRPSNNEQSAELAISDEQIAKASRHFENLKRWLEHEEIDRKCVENQIEIAERDLDWLEVDLLKSKLAAMKNSERITEQLIVKASNSFRLLQTHQAQQKLHQNAAPEKVCFIQAAIITDLRGNPHSRTDLSEIHGL